MDEDNLQDNDLVSKSSGSTPLFKGKLHLSLQDAEAFTPQTPGLQVPLANRDPLASRPERVINCSIVTGPSPATLAPGNIPTVSFSMTRHANFFFESLIRDFITVSS